LLTIKQNLKRKHPKGKEPSSGKVRKRLKRHTIAVQIIIRILYEPATENKEMVKLPVVSLSASTPVKNPCQSKTNDGRNAQNRPQSPTQTAG
jgi:hypothetical protein